SPDRSSSRKTDMHVCARPGTSEPVHHNPSISDWCFSDRLESGSYQSFQLCSPASRRTLTTTHQRLNAPRSDDESCSSFSNPRWRSDQRGFEKLEHRSEEHTSELQSRENLVCRLLLE